MSTINRKQIERKNRRQVILDAAESIMRANGVYGLNIDLIAAETQLAKGTIYLYFKSKEEILATIALKARNLLLQEFKRASDTKEEPIERLKAIVTTSYRFHTENPLYNDLVSLYEANNQLVETAELQTASNNIIHLVAGIAQEAKESGSLNPNINPLHFTICMWGMTIGMQQMIKVRGKIFEENFNISESDILSSFIQIFENGIKS
jgi:AcrR family transcriptional regulator